MKNKILPALAIAAFISTTAFAQKSKTYAITSESKGSYNWSILREVDLSTGEVIKTLYDKALNKNLEIINTEKRRIVTSVNIASDIKLMPMAEGVAAAAYDARNNRLYYTPMRGNDLRYFDLNSAEGKVVYHQAQPIFTGNRYNEANVITRMAFASDGYGYALTNDGNHLIRFSTDQKSSITDLGGVLDGKKNGSVSIHNQCSSWGGDMVGDAYGNLYVITYRNYLFKINPQTKIADLVGQVKGLPAQFTSNGMVVNDEGDLVLSSAMVSDNYYKLNPSTLEATPLKNNSAVYNSSDLANGNLLFQNNAAPKNIFTEVKSNHAISVYPNPVTLRTFTVQFDKIAAGRYNIVLIDASGRNVITRSLNINALGQVEKINLPRTSAGGMYLVKLTGNNSKVVFSDKIVVQ